MPHDLARYHRQSLLPGFGDEGQCRLLNSTALILGCGALGTVSAGMLARAGVGHLVIVDRDFVDLTNLQRQVLFDEQDVADDIPKAIAAKRKIADINSQVRVTAIVDDINHRNIERFAEGVDILVDGLDNFETRYLANDLAVKRGLPYIYGGAVGTSGMAYAILPHTQAGNSAWETSPGGSKATPCFRCIFEDPPPTGESPTCDTVGVLGPVVSIIANFQVSETLKILSGNLDRICPTMLNIDLWTNSILQLKVANARENANCPCCKQRNFEFLQGTAQPSAVSLCGHNAVQLTHRQGSGSMNIDEIAARLARTNPVKANEFMIRAHISENGKAYELTLFRDGRAIVKGTGDASEARGIFAKFIGN
jgi:adenylyltransferase/sulfurtransferase